MDDAYHSTLPDRAFSLKEKNPVRVADRTLRIIFQSKTYDWFTLDNDKLGTEVGIAKFIQKLRINIAHYFKVPEKYQVFCDVGGLLSSNVKFARALRDIQPCLQVHDLREMSSSLRETIEELGLKIGELGLENRELGKKILNLGNAEAEGVAEEFVAIPLMNPVMKSSEWLLNQMKALNWASFTIRRPGSSFSANFSTQECIRNPKVLSDYSYEISSSSDLVLQNSSSTLPAVIFIVRTCNSPLGHTWLLEQVQMRGWSSFRVKHPKGMVFEAPAVRPHNDWSSLAEYLSGIEDGAELIVQQCGAFSESTTASAESLATVPMQVRQAAVDVPNGIEVRLKDSISPHRNATEGHGGHVNGKVNVRKMQDGSSENRLAPPRPTMRSVSKNRTVTDSHRTASKSPFASGYWSADSKRPTTPPVASRTSRQRLPSPGHVSPEATGRSKSFRLPSPGRGVSPEGITTRRIRLPTSEPLRQSVSPVTATRNLRPASPTTSTRHLTTASPATSPVLRASSPGGLRAVSPATSSVFRASSSGGLGEVARPFSPSRGSSPLRVARPVSPDRILRSDQQAFVGRACSPGRIGYQVSGFGPHGSGWHPAMPSLPSPPQTYLQQGSLTPLDLHFGTQAPQAHRWITPPPPMPFIATAPAPHHLPASPIPSPRMAQAPSPVALGMPVMGTPGVMMIVPPVNTAEQYALAGIHEVFLCKEKNPGPWPLVGDEEEDDEELGSESKQMFGFANIPAKEGNGLDVSWIHSDALLAQWNSNFPDRAVGPGDRVVAVNGVWDDIDKMRKELERDRVVLLVRRKKKKDP